jgi:DsbC/DsbD-like thiol-disulfide interchange protein
MNRKIFLGAVFCLIFAASSSVSAQTVSGTVGNGTVERGKAARGSVSFSIPGGLHVNSNRPGSEYAIATTVRVRGAGVKVGGVSYPRGRNRKFSFSENSINVYEGRVSFPFTVTVPANFRGSSVRLTATVRYQACTNEVCYPPTSKTAVITARIK